MTGDSVSVICALCSNMQRNASRLLRLATLAEWSQQQAWQIRFFDALDANLHLRCPSGRAARPEQRIPDTQDRRIIRIGVLADSMVMHPVDRGRHNDM